MNEENDEKAKSGAVELLIDKYYYAMKRSYNCALEGLESNYWYYQGEANTVAELLIIIFKEPHPRMSEPRNKNLKTHVHELKRQYESTWKQESVIVKKEVSE